ncbi:hypothetical protein [Pedobacter sp. SYSU D00535]|uniref:hypothetical protein n=1 Tax=Pedobacter sp. SYSU D00535 TaxID=2810308 RepID=UPI001A956439|nr:hypothetical protein [Pedobacter sp. SYSU D00535]
MLRAWSTFYNLLKTTEMSLKILAASILSITLCCLLYILVENNKQKDREEALSYLEYSSPGEYSRPGVATGSNSEHVDSSYWEADTAFTDTVFTSRESPDSLGAILPDGGGADPQFGVVLPPQKESVQKIAYNSSSPAANLVKSALWGFLLWVVTIIGMFCYTVFTCLAPTTDKVNIRAVLSQCVSSGSFIRAVVISPIILCTTYFLTKSSSDYAMVLFNSFYSGFFWITTLEKVQKKPLGE